MFRPCIKSPQATAVREFWRRSFFTFVSSAQTLATACPARIDRPRVFLRCFFFFFLPVVFALPDPKALWMCPWTLAGSRRASSPQCRQTRRLHLPTWLVSMPGQSPFAHPGFRSWLFITRTHIFVYASNCTYCNATTAVVQREAETENLLKTWTYTTPSPSPCRARPSPSVPPSFPLLPFPRRSYFCPTTDNTGNSRRQRPA